MNIWIGLLFLDGALPDVRLARELGSEAPAARIPLPAAPADPAGRREYQSTRVAVAPRGPSGAARR